MPRTLTVNVSPKIVESLDSLAATHKPWASRHLIHRLALEIGLEQLAADPAQIAALVARVRETARQS